MALRIIKWLHICKSNKKHRQSVETQATMKCFIVFLNKISNLYSQQRHIYNRVLLYKKG